MFGNCLSDPDLSCEGLIVFLVASLPASCERGTVLAEGQGLGGWDGSFRSPVAWGPDGLVAFTGNVGGTFGEVSLLDLNNDSVNVNLTSGFASNFAPACTNL